MEKQCWSQPIAREDFCINGKRIFNGGGYTVVVAASLILISLISGLRSSSSSSIVRSHPPVCSLSSLFVLSFHRLKKSIENILENSLLFLSFSYVVRRVKQFKENILTISNM